MAFLDVNVFITSASDGSSDRPGVGCPRHRKSPMTPGRGHVPFLLMHLRAVPWPRPARPPAARLQFCFLAWQPGSLQRHFRSGSPERACSCRGPSLRSSETRTRPWASSCEGFSLAVTGTRPRRVRVRMGKVSIWLHVRGFSPYRTLPCIRGKQPLGGILHLVVGPLSSTEPGGEGSAPAEALTQERSRLGF